MKARLVRVLRTHLQVECLGQTSIKARRADQEQGLALVLEVTLL